jgi:hypothetical protein
VGRARAAPPSLGFPGLGLRDQPVRALEARGVEVEQGGRARSGGGGGTARSRLLSGCRPVPAVCLLFACMCGGPRAARAHRPPRFVPDPWMRIAAHLAGTWVCGLRFEPIIPAPPFAGCTTKL